MNNRTGRPRNPIRSWRKDLNIHVARPITDVRVQRAVDWIEENNQKRRAAPMAFQLLVAALAGELGPGMQVAVERGDVELAREAAREMKSFFVVEDDDE